MGDTGRSIALGLALAAALTAAPRDSRAADSDKPSYELGLYVWGNSLVSEIDTDEGTATSRIPFSDLLDNLNVAAMLRARANFDKLSLVFDGESFDLESDTHRQTIRLGPQGNLEVEASAKVKLVQYILELNAGYQIFDLDAPYSLVRGDELRTRGELYAGARYLSMKPEVEVQVGLPRVLWPIPPAYGHVVAFNDDGLVVADLQDPGGSYPETTGVTETSDRLYVHSLHAAAIVWLPR